MGIGTVLACIAIGLVAGTTARIVLPGPDPIGVLGTTAIALGASLTGGAVGAWFIAQPTIFVRPVGPVWMALAITALVISLVRVFGRGFDATVD